MVFVNEADQGGKRLKIGKKNNKKNPGFRRKTLPIVSPATRSRECAADSHCIR